MNSPFSLYDQFGQIAVISLQRRGDRWARFVKNLPASWPFRAPRRFLAIDGNELGVPQHWMSSPGAYGCYLSHLSVLKQAIDDKVKSLLVLEDDAVVCESFSTDALHFFRELPTDWDMLYLGGQHIELEIRAPVKVSPWVFRSFNVNRAHAYALNGLSVIRAAYEFLLNPKNWPSMHHVDHFLGEFQKSKPTPTYVPKKWLIAQDDGVSDIARQSFSLRVFQGAEDVADPQLHLPMVAAVGSFFSGAGELTEALTLLGAANSRVFDKPNILEYKGCTESSLLGTYCRSMLDVERQEKKLSKETCVRLLKTWACGHTKEYQLTHTLAIAKCCLFMLLGRELQEAWQPTFVHVRRDLGEIMAAIGAKLPNQINGIESLLTWMHNEWLAFEQTENGAKIISINFADLHNRPIEVLTTLCEELNLGANCDQIYRIVKQLPLSSG